MLKTSALAACLLAAATLGACTTIDPNTGETVRNNTGSGAIAGAFGGALLGYLTNTSDGEQGRKNALLGAGIGALGGAAVGQQLFDLGVPRVGERRLRRDRVASRFSSVKRVPSTKLMTVVGKWRNFSQALRVVSISLPLRCGLRSKNSRE